MTTFDTSKARASILQRIRAKQGRADGPNEEQAEIDRYLGQHSSGPRPRRPADLRQQFRAMAERMSSTVHEVDTIVDAPQAAARYLASQDIALRAVIWPALSHLDWTSAGIFAEARAPKRDESDGADLVGITGCFCALAETGTLMLLSGPQTIASTHLLPETHIAIVPASRIVADMEDAFALLRSERGGPESMMPRAVNMISGPSRTGDIEQTIVLGAHGPYRVHLIVAREE
ncbi:MAG: LutC/YkgG family protein [Burkholderiaceae bacterium]